MHILFSILSKVSIATRPLYHRNCFRFNRNLLAYISSSLLSIMWLFFSFHPLELKFSLSLSLSRITLL